MSKPPPGPPKPKQKKKLTIKIPPSFWFFLLAVALVGFYYTGPMTWFALVLAILGGVYFLERTQDFVEGRQGSEFTERTKMLRFPLLILILWSGYTGIVEDYREKMFQESHAAAEREKEAEMYSSVSKRKTAVSKTKAKPKAKAQAKPKQVARR